MIVDKKCYFCYRIFRYQTNSNKLYEKCSGCLHNINVSVCKNVNDKSNLNYNIGMNNLDGFSKRKTQYECKNNINLKIFNKRYNNLMYKYDELYTKYMSNISKMKFYKNLCQKINRDIDKCSVCLLENRNTAFIPCGHLCCCNNCAKRCKLVCPICRNGATSIHKIYLP